MSEKKDDIIEGPGFTIIDRRISARTSQGESEEKTDEGAIKGKEKPAKKKQMQEEARRETGERTPSEPPLPEVDFPSFIMSLSTSVFIHLGEIPDPTTNERIVNLPLAKQTIDLIAMLKGKTEGNRTQEEDMLMDDLLYNLRMRFLAASQKKS